MYTATLALRSHRWDAKYQSMLGGHEPGFRGFVGQLNTFDFGNFDDSARPSKPLSPTDRVPPPPKPSASPLPSPLRHVITAAPPASAPPVYSSPHWAAVRTAVNAITAVTRTAALVEEQRH